MSGTSPSLSVRGLTAGYGRRPVIQDFALDLKAGEILGIVGPNGAGKSTLLKTLGGALSAESGEIRLGDDLASDLGSLEKARRIAVVPQTAIVEFPFTVREYVEHGRFPHLGPFRRFTDSDREAVRAALAKTGLATFADRRIDELSGGELQRVTLARALAQQSSVMLLDEPNAHLDLHFQQTLFEVLHELVRQSVAVLCVLHDLNLAAEYCHRLLLMVNGRTLALGPPKEVLSEENLRAAYDCEVVVECMADGTPFIRHKIDPNPQAEEIHAG